MDTSDPFTLGHELGYQEYMISRYVEMLGNREAIKLFLFNEKKLPVSIRLNDLRAPFDLTIRLLKQKNVELEDVKDFPEAKVVVKTKVPIGATPEYLNGYYMLQGFNSLYPVKVLNPQPGELIGDLAAAPGGKTTYMAQRMKNNGTIVAIDVNTNRCRALRSNLARMGVINTIVLNIDARDVTKLNLKFDRILLDAPCSGSGVIVSDPTRKSSKSLSDLKHYSEYQYQLLLSALKTLKKGGTLVYCTCSLEPEENELVISKVLKQGTVEICETGINGDSGLTKFKAYTFDESLSKATRLYPHKTGGEGFFIAKLKKL